MVEKGESLPSWATTQSKKKEEGAETGLSSHCTRLGEMSIPSREFKETTHSFKALFMLNK
jgi:hypothetical protein